MINIGDNLGYKGTKSNFVRDSFNTVSIMAAISDTNIDDGHISYSIDTNKHYKFNRNNTVDPIIGKWRLIFSDTLGLSEDISINQKTITNNFLTINSNIALKLNKLISGVGILISNDNTISASITSYTYAGTVATTSELPQSSTIGYFYCVTNDIVPNTNYAWNGTNWQSIGNSLYSLATETKSGLLSFVDKQKINLLQRTNQDGLYICDTDKNVSLKYDNSGFDVALISAHMLLLIKSIDGISLLLGETSTTAYAGDKGKSNETEISSVSTLLQQLTFDNAEDHTTYSTNILLLQLLLTILTNRVSDLQGLLTQSTENGFHVSDSSGNVGMRYDSNGFDAALISAHFQELINQLISISITAAKGSTIAPLVDSLIPSTYLPSYVDDVITIDIFGSAAITLYCTDNDGNAEVLTDKFCYDDENGIFVIAHQVNNAIELTNSNIPEFGKIYIDIYTNKTYRWSGTTMVVISNDMSLGETSGTAYAGDKGKLNADNIIIAMSLISALRSTVTILTSIVSKVNESGYYIVDSSGKVGLKYNVDGFDVAFLSEHFKNLIKTIEGIGGTTSPSSIISAISSMLRQSSNDGFYVTDHSGNVGMKYDQNGLDVSSLSTHFRSLLTNYFVQNSTFSSLSLNTSDGLLSIYHQKEVRLCLQSTAKIILYGDSISSTDYTFYKERMQYYTGIVDVNNKGLSGKTTAFLASDAALASILNYEPDLIIIQVGGNDVGDVVGTFGAVPSEDNVVETNITIDYNGTYWILAVSHIIRKVKAHYYDIVTRAALTGTETASEKIAKIVAVKKPHIAVLTPTPQKRSGGNLTWSYQPNWIRKRNAVVECCNKYNVQCIDIYSDWGVDMSLEPEWSSPTDQVNQHGIYTMDGLHPSQAGYERMVQLITGKINIKINS